MCSAGRRPGVFTPWLWSRAGGTLINDHHNFVTYNLTIILSYNGTWTRWNLPCSKPASTLSISPASPPTPPPTPPASPPPQKTRHNPCLRNNPAQSSRGKTRCSRSTFHSDWCQWVQVECSASSSYSWPHFEMENSAVTEWHLVCTEQYKVEDKPICFSYCHNAW